MLEAIDMFEAEVIEDKDNLFTDHTHTCVACGASYRTCNPKTGGYCSRCIVTRLSSPAATDTRITCRVCEAPATVPIDHPALLCPNCLIDLDATRDRVAAWLTSALTRLDANDAQWREAIRTSDAAERWPAIQGALIAVAERRASQADLDRTWRKRKAEGGALALLLGAHEAYAETADRIGEELEKLGLAQREINTAFLATEL